MNNWKNIDSAPTDDTEILCIFHNFERGVCHCLDGVWYAEGWALPVNPTLWMELPDLPTKEVSIPCGKVVLRNIYLHERVAIGMGEKGAWDVTGYRVIAKSIDISDFERLRDLQPEYVILEGKNKKVKIKSDKCNFEYNGAMDLMAELDIHEIEILESHETN